MNCPDFERMIVDLARDQIMEASARESGLAHAQDCARCAARLADERVLTQGLRSLAMSVQQVEAPARVETMLLAAFRERDKAALLKPAVQPAPVVARTHWRWATGIAAAVALLFVAFAATRMQQPSLRQLLLARAPQPLKISTAVSVPVEPSINPVPVGLASGRGPQSQLTSVRTFGRRHNNPEGINRAEDSSRSLQPVNAVASNSTMSDIATDFIPLRYGAGLDGMDGGHVVRVELPRTALAQFGLPVDVERSTEPVKADVLMGDDGLARAIRFVR
jgi:hypothetical protein